MIDRFEKLILKHNMFKKGDSVVVALSGGSDSVCLLILLCQLREKWSIKINCAHINHGIREEADDDEKFCFELAKRQNCGFYSEKYNVPEIARREKISSELCGRNLRYAFFEKVLSETKSSAILTAHNKNDNAESFILHLLRGSGSAGLGGIYYSRGNIKRPMLDFTKSEIEEYLKSEGVSWVEDKTNKEDVYTRNMVRHNIIPRFEEINPSACDAILRCSALLKEDDDFLCALAEKENAAAYKEDGAEIDVIKLQNAAAPVGKRICTAVIKKCSLQLSEATVNGLYALKDMQSGKKFIFPCGAVAVRTYEKIIVQKNNKSADFLYKIQAGDKIFIKEIDTFVSLLSEKPQKPYLEIKDAGGEYMVKKPQKGDKFIPSGMNGHKKISDFFADKKIPANEREKIPVFVCDGEICAVGMLRRAEKFSPSEKDKKLYIKTGLN